MEERATAGTPPVPSARALQFTDRKRFWWKTGLLAFTTIALIPILLLKDEGLATLYVWSLIVVHVAGIFVVAVGVRRHQIAPDRRGLLIRLVAIAILVGLLFVASKGLDSQVRGFLFWGSLFAIWALHTVGLLLLHVRGRREAAACPFV